MRPETCFQSLAQKSAISGQSGHHIKKEQETAVFAWLAHGLGGMGTARIYQHWSIFAAKGCVGQRQLRSTRGDFPSMHQTASI